MTSPIDGTNSTPASTQKNQDPSSNSTTTQGQNQEINAQSAAFSQQVGANTANNLPPLPSFGDEDSESSGVTEDSLSEQTSDTFSAQQSQQSQQNQQIQDSNKKDDDKKDDTKKDDSQTSQVGPAQPQTQNIQQPQVTAPNQVPPALNTAIDQVANHILVSTGKLGAGDEVRMSLKTPSLEGTEVIIQKDGNNLNINFVASTQEASNMLSQNQGALQQALANKLQNTNINVQVSTPQNSQTSGNNNEGHSRGGDGGQQGQQGQNQGQNQ